MSYLLDTHVLLWAAGTPERLPSEALTLIEDPTSELYFSVASLWEVAIKSGLGRADFNVDARLLRRGLLNHGYLELTITGTHAIGYRHTSPHTQRPV